MGTFTKRYLKKRGKAKAWNDPSVLAIHCVEGKAPGHTHTCVAAKAPKTVSKLVGTSVIRVAYNRESITLTGDASVERPFDPKKVPLAPTKDFTSRGMLASGSTLLSK